MKWINLKNKNSGYIYGFGVGCAVGLMFPPFPIWMPVFGIIFAQLFHNSLDDEPTNTQHPTKEEERT